jgi:hypothetical protein
MQMHACPWHDIIGGLIDWSRRTEWFFAIPFVTGTPDRNGSAQARASQASEP